jgi:NAD(P)-dependent dehydrogenase (short-subunit alcohol dehydrogenase family)
MNSDGKVAVVTGATKGVGRGIARELALRGARVFVTGRSASDRNLSMSASQAFAATIESKPMSKPHSSGSFERLRRLMS